MVWFQRMNCEQWPGLLCLASPRCRRAGGLSLVKTCWVFAKVRLAQEACAAVRSVPGPTSVMAGINSVEQTLVKRHPAVGTSKSHVCTQATTSRSECATTMLVCANGNGRR